MYNLYKKCLPEWLEKEVMIDFVWKGTQSVLEKKSGIWVLHNCVLGEKTAFTDSITVMTSKFIQGFLTEADYVWACPRKSSHKKVNREEFLQHIAWNSEIEFLHKGIAYFATSTQVNGKSVRQIVDLYHRSTQEYCDVEDFLNSIKLNAEPIDNCWNEIIVMSYI